MEEQSHSLELNKFNPDTYNAYMQALICLPHGEEIQLGTFSVESGL